MTGTFNLLDEPWLLVTDLDSRSAEVSIQEAFARAHQLAGVRGDLPSQEVALLRLLVSILYRALRVEGPLEQRMAAWGRWWVDGTLPVADVSGYLEAHRDRFDLLDPRAPFMQVAGLRAGKTSGLSKLVADVPDGEQFFTTRAGQALDSIGLAEAARWLVHVHAFDPSGIKSGAVGDPRVKGGKGYPIGTGWGGQCGVLIPQGRTLKETLLLCLALQLESAGAGWGRDQPVWEREPHSAAPDRGHEEPSGTADLLTWQARRVLLVTAGERVVDALICNGDAIHPRNRHQLEPHTAWRRSPHQEKLHGGTVYMPRGHNPERALWRGLPGLLPQGVEQRPAGSTAAASLPPNVLEWLGLLVRDGALEAAYPVHLHAVGVSYGSQNSTIGSMVDDRLRLPAAIFAHRELATLAADMVVASEGAVAALRGLAANLAQAAGEWETEGPRERAGEAGYAALDQRFRRWVAALLPDSDPEACLVEWHTHALRTINAIGADLVRAAGQPAWVGRVVTTGAGVKHHVDASLATAWFRAALGSSLPQAATPPTRRPTETDTHQSTNHSVSAEARTEE
ncbi:MAG TPA: type I-E CRISPR-associated protein Cse1/CasA [Phycicoccus elongatus]|jgi:CRISPR system Cascade subunit CasA|nr:type I-E CRISPR-associated protein Cse1/CasA [Phycicoccus elongatus]